MHFLVVEKASVSKIEIHVGIDISLSESRGREKESRSCCKSRTSAYDVRDSHVWEMKQHGFCTAGVSTQNYFLTRIQFKYIYWTPRTSNRFSNTFFALTFSLTLFVLTARVQVHRLRFHRVPFLDAFANKYQCARKPIGCLSWTGS